MKTITNVLFPGSAGKPILADIFYKDNGKPKPVIIFSHGFKGFKDRGAFNLIARQFADNGFVFVKFNYSYNGTTPEHPDEFADLEAFGNNNYSIELNDLGIVIDKICSGDLIPANEINIGNIFLLGHSRGGGLSILKSFEDPRIKKLVTWASVNNMAWGWTDEILKKWKEDGVRYTQNKRTKQKMPLYYQFPENYLENKKRLDVENAVGNTEIPFMVIHGTEDEIPISMAIGMKRWNTNIRLELLPGADHVFGARHPFTDEELPIDLQIALNYTMEFFRD